MTWDEEIVESSERHRAEIAAFDAELYRAPWPDGGAEEWIARRLFEYELAAGAPPREIRLTSHAVRLIIGEQMSARRFASVNLSGQLTFEGIPLVRDDTLPRFTVVMQ